jgi:hypothetical protein
VVEKSGEQLEDQNSAAADSGAPGLADRNLDDDAILKRHAELVARDNVMGLEARVVMLENKVSTLINRNKRLRKRAEEAEAQVASIHASRTWRMGRLFARPFGRLKG